MVYENKDFVYDDYVEFDSSVLLQAWHDRDRQNLVVRLHNDTLCGYYDVGLATFNALKNASSAGAYWNAHIRHHHAGFSTSGILEFVIRDEDTTHETLEDVAVPLTSYEVAVQISGVFKQPIDAVDISTAIREVQEKFAALGLTAKVVSVNERD